MEHNQAKPDLQPEELAELEAERNLNARVHRHMGMTATILVIVAVGVALSRMKVMFGISAWEALGIGSSALPWLLLILGAAAAFSLGTTRLLQGIDWIIRTTTGKKAGK